MKHVYPVGKIRPSTPLLLAGLLLTFSLTALAQPTVTSVSPSPNARAAGRTSSVTVGFSQPLSAGSAGALKVFSSQRGGLRTRGTTPAVVSGSTLQFTPSAYPFVPGETVFSTITRAAAGAGGALARPRVSQFTAAVGGTGTGNFILHPVAPYVNVQMNPQSMAVADLDGDGDQDMLVGNIMYTTTINFIISVRFNDGTGNYSAGYEVTLPTGLMPVGLATGDVDGDGNVDLVVAGGVAGSVLVYANTGQGTFASPTRLTAPNAPTTVALGDVDGDGDLDIVTADYVSNSALYVYANNGSGTFTLRTGTPPLTLGSGPRRVVLGDVDGDGDLDLVVANDGNRTQNYSVNVCLNDGAGSFTIPSNGTWRPPTNAVDLVLGDVDGDGDLDLLNANYGTASNSGNSVSVRLNNGTGFFTPHPTNPTLSFVNGLPPKKLVLGDFDADGDLDLIFSSSSGSALVFLNNGQGSFVQPAVNSSFYAGSENELALADVDGDGDLDVVACSDPAQASVHLNYPPQGIPLAVRITGDSVLCGGGQVQLSAVATPAALSYRWSTGATTASIQVSQTGTYAVTVTASGAQTRSAQRQVRVIAPPVQVSGDSILCPGVSLALVGTAPNATTVHWNTGATTAALTVTQPGTYTFTARYGSGCSTSRQVVVRAPTLAIAGARAVCQGSSVALTATAPGATAYRWNTGATTPSISVTQAGTYSVVATYPGGCSLNASETVSQPVAVIGGDSIGCAGRPAALTAAQAGATGYLWNTGAATPGISVSQAGLYSVVVTYANGCQSTARHSIRILPTLAPFSLGADTMLCEGASLLLRGPAAGRAAGATYRWSTGAPTPTLLVRETGTYSLQLATACDTQTANRFVQFTPCLTLPNVITPNGDRRNDRFEVVGMTGDWSLQVYSRWGQRVFTTPAYRNDWGETAAAGMYYYLLQKPGSPMPYKGWLEVLR